MVLTHSEKQKGTEDQDIAHTPDFWQRSKLHMEDKIIFQWYYFHLFFWKFLTCINVSGPYLLFIPMSARSLSSMFLSSLSYHQPRSVSTAHSAWVWGTLCSKVCLLHFQRTHLSSPCSHQLSKGMGTVCPSSIHTKTPSSGMMLEKLDNHM